eukprot:gene8249-9814_t
MLHPDGTVQEGTWHNGRLNGACKIISFNGQILKGDFKDGKIFNGSGVRVIEDGSSYEGTWVKGRMKGKMKYTHANGMVTVEDRGDSF